MSGILKAVNLIEGLKSESISWADKVKRNPSIYGQSGRTLPALLDMVKMYKPGQFKGQLSVFKVTINGQPRFFATDQRTLKRELGASADFTLVGHIIPQRTVGQKPTWMPKR